MFVHSVLVLGLVSSFALAQKCYSLDGQDLDGMIAGLDSGLLMLIIPRHLQALQSQCQVQFLLRTERYRPNQQRHLPGFWLMPIHKRMVCGLSLGKRLYRSHRESQCLSTSVLWEYVKLHQYCGRGLIELVPEQYSFNVLQCNPGAFCCRAGYDQASFSTTKMDSD